MRVLFNNREVVFRLSDVLAVLMIMMMIMLLRDEQRGGICGGSECGDSEWMKL